jgi:hypothetical protein
MSDHPLLYNVNEIVRDRIDAARNVIMRAQWMSMCAAGCTVSEIVAREMAIEVTLMYVHEILGQVAEDLDPANLLLLEGQERWYPPSDPRRKRGPDQD